MIRARARLFGALFVVASIGAGAFALFACGPTPDPTRVTDIYTYDNSFTQFAGGGALGAGVEGVLEARCASLDCHGQEGRPLRLFSQNGLRNFDDAGGGTNVSGYTNGPVSAPATTPNEMFENYTAVISLQPELMSLVLSGNADPSQLLFLRKPRAMERHKGGAVIQVGDHSDNCILSWLSGTFDPTECTNSVNAH